MYKPKRFPGSLASSESGLSPVIDFMTRRRTEDVKPYSGLVRELSDLRGGTTGEVNHTYYFINSFHHSVWSTLKEQSAQDNFELGLDFISFFNKYGHSQRNPGFLELREDGRNDADFESIDYLVRERLDTNGRKWFHIQPEGNHASMDIFQEGFLNQYFFQLTTQPSPMSWSEICSA